MNKCWNVINTDGADSTDKISDCKTQCYVRTYNYVLTNDDKSKNYTYFVERDCREQSIPGKYKPNFYKMEIPFGLL